VNASPAGSNWTFTGFSGGALSGTATPQNLLMNAPYTVAANFTDPNFINVTTSPTGLHLTVDGSSCTSGFNCPPLVAGTYHTLTAPSPQQINGTPYTFYLWTGGYTTQTITILASQTAPTITAYFNAMSGNCADAATNGGVYMQPPVSTISRPNGNDVRMHSESVLYGPNAGIAIAHVTTYYYRDGVLRSTDTATSGYGGTAAVDKDQPLYSNSQYFTGLFQLGSASGNLNDHWADSPICQGLGYGVVPHHFYDASSSYSAVKPTVTGVNAIWYLGGVSGTPDSNGINQVDGYDLQSRLTGNANWGASPPVIWTVTQNAVNGGRVSLSASVANQNTITSVAPSGSNPSVGYVNDVSIQISTDGLPSDPFPMTINAPYSITKRDLGAGSNPYGYENDFAYTVLDLAGRPLLPITLHETFENAKLIPPFNTTQGDPNYSNWLSYAPSATAWTPSDWMLGPAGNYEFMDHANASDNPPGTLTPTPITFSTNPRAVDDISQKFFIGGPTANTFDGQCVYLGKVTYFTDHGEVTGNSPPPPNPVSGQPPCAVGIFGNGN
jgi:hypothetical protein